MLGWGGGQVAGGLGEDMAGCWGWRGVGAGGRGSWMKRADFYQ